MQPAPETVSRGPPPPVFIDERGIRYHSIGTAGRIIGVHLIATQTLRNYVTGKRPVPGGIDFGTIHRPYKRSNFSRKTGLCYQPVDHHRDQQILLREDAILNLRDLLQDTANKNRVSINTKKLAVMNEQGRRLSCPRPGPKPGFRHSALG